MKAGGERAKATRRRGVEEDAGTRRRGEGAKGSSSAKLMAKAGKVAIVAIRSSKVRGTSSETTSSVMAKPKTASARPSSRDTSRLRQRNLLFAPTPLSISFP